MKAKKYNWILYLIITTIVTTIAVQFYWNYKNYEENKQRVLNEIQISLDKAIDDYYTNISKKNFLTIVESDKLTSTNDPQNKAIWQEVFAQVVNTKKDSSEKDSFKTNIQLRSLQIRKDSTIPKTDSVIVNNLFKQADLRYQDHIPQGKKISNILQLGKDGNNGIRFDRDSSNKVNSVQVFRGINARDSLKLIKGLKTVFIAIHNDSLAYENLDSLLTNELKEKKINVSFAFKHYKNDTLFYDYKVSDTNDKYVVINSESTFFNDNERLNLLHSNPSTEALKRSSTGILLSLVLSLAVISSLFYLLKIINQQKELAEIKNDLISNITHEFKTPIATVSTAVEALENFNVTADKEKTKKYLNISSLQLTKLHGMVEKLLETATLDSEKLLLNKEPENLVDLVEKLVNKHSLLADNKNLNFSTNVKELFIKIDLFHFENAISNLIDNAIKYGGNTIEVNITSLLNTVEISVADNGSGIDKNQIDKIFDKFYRIPKGNIHDVKGFGIGLYYTKKIIEKHQGSIRVSSKINNTIFKVSLPNE